MSARRRILEERCGDSGVLYCYCAGDGCACHYHGETECDGCEDCEPYIEYEHQEAIDEMGDDEDALLVGRV